MPIANTPPRDAAELAAPPVKGTAEDVGEVELLEMVDVARVGAAVVVGAAELETTTAAEVDVDTAADEDTAAGVELVGAAAAAVLLEAVGGLAQRALAAGRTSAVAS